MLSLYHDGKSTFLFVNAIKIYQFKGKNPEMNPHPLILGNISEDGIIDQIKKTELKRYLHDVSVYYNIINTKNISDIHKYLIKIR